MHGRAVKRLVLRIKSGRVVSPEPPPLTVADVRVLCSSKMGTTESLRNALLIQNAMDLIDTLPATDVFCDPEMESMRPGAAFKVPQWGINMTTPGPLGRGPQTTTTWQPQRPPCLVDVAPALQPQNDSDSAELVSVKRKRGPIDTYSSAERPPKMHKMSVDVQAQPACQPLKSPTQSRDVLSVLVCGH